MKFRKVITVFSMVLMSVFVLMGCATIETYRIVNPDYSIIDEIVITLDRSKLDKVGKYSEVKNGVENDMLTFATYVNDWIDLFEEDYPMIHSLLKKGITCSKEETSQDNQIKFVMNFAGIEYFSFFYGLDCATEELQDIMSSELYHKALTDIGPFVSKMSAGDYNRENMGLFLYKYYMFGSSGLMSGLEGFEEELGARDYVEKYSSMTHYTLDDVDIIQNFTYPDTTIKSNADDTETVGGMTFMSWDISDKTDDFEMEIYYVGARPTAWYVLALILTAGATVGIYFLIKKKYNKDRVKITKQEIENNGR